MPLSHGHQLGARPGGGKLARGVVGQEEFTAGYRAEERLASAAFDQELELNMTFGRLVL